MAPVSRLALLLALFCIAAGASSGAPGSGITLQLRDVTLAEAAAAITRASGTAVEVGPAGGGAARAGFDWENASLDRALRDVCARFGGACSRGAAAYTLYLTGPFRKSPVTFEKEGVRIALGGVAVSERRGGTVLAGARGEPTFASLELSLVVDLDAARADWDARFENAAARDNLGNPLRARFPGLPLRTTFPSQRAGNLGLPLGDVRAQRLASVEGELVLSRRRGGPAGADRIELPYPAPGAVVQRRITEDLALAVSEARPPAPTPAADHPEAPAAPLAYAAFEAEQGPSLLMRAYRSTDPKNPDASDSFRAPRAVGRSGKSYPGRSSLGGARSDQGRTLSYTVVFFPGAEEPLEKLVWDLPTETEREARIRFRLADVPIPAADGLPAQYESLSARRDLPTAPPSPYGRPGGAALRSEVLLLGKPAPEGQLRLGLSTQSLGEWLPARWCRAAVDASGAAVLTGVAPGRYRVLREYGASRPVPDGENGSVPAGRWLNAEAEITVPEGGTAALPPLELTAAPPAPAAPAAAPAAGGPFERDGLVIEPASVGLLTGRAAQWEGQRALDFYARGEVSVSGRLKPAGAAAGEGVPLVRSVSARDDLGTVLTAPDEIPSFFAPSGPSTDLRFRFSAAHPAARKLAWIEGELFRYRRHRHLRLEAPFPPPGRSILIRDGANLMVTVSNEAPPPAPKPAAPAEPDLLPAGGPSPPGEPRVRYRFCYRDGVLEGQRGEMALLAPTAVGKSGATFRPRGGGGMSTTVEGWILHGLRATYPGAGEPLEKLVWEVDFWDTAEPLGVFRMRDVELPVPRPR